MTIFHLGTEGRVLRSISTLWARYAPLLTRVLESYPLNAYPIIFKSDLHVLLSSWFSSFGDAPNGFSEEIREFQVSVGAEYWYNNQFALRLGYFHEDKTKGNRRYFTGGVGIKYNIFGLNFSYLLPSGSGVNRNPLSNTLRFSLVFDLDGAAAAAQ